MDRSAQSTARRYEALLTLLSTTNGLWEASRLFFDQWRISPSQFNVLNLLQLHPAGLSQTDLGRQLLTHRSNVTGLIDRLERRQLVRRETVSEDRRAYRVVLTPKGTRLLGEILPHYHIEADHVWDGVTDQSISGFLSVLARVQQNADTVVTRLPRNVKRGPSGENRD